MTCIITSKMSRQVKVWKLGEINYSLGLKLQKYIADLHHNDTKNHDTLLLLEHPPVYTIGIRHKDYTPEDEARLKQTGAEFFKTNRGGLITFHGPGQLVVYPIINLKNYKTSMRWYVCSIERTIIDLCEKLGLRGETSPHTGVWIGDNKVCAIGVHGSRYVTTHGLALNCNTDLEWFKYIVPCGIEGKGVTSLSKELGKNFTTEQIIPLFINSFSKIFNCSCVSFPEKETYNILTTINQIN